MTRREELEGRLRAIREARTDWARELSSEIVADLAEQLQRARAAGESSLELDARLQRWREQYLLDLSATYAAERAEVAAIENELLAAGGARRRPLTGNDHDTHP